MYQFISNIILSFFIYFYYYLLVVTWFILNEFDQIKDQHEWKYIMVIILLFFIIISYPDEDLLHVYVHMMCLSKILSHVLKVSFLMHHRSISIKLYKKIILKVIYA